MNNRSQTCEVCGARLPANAPGGPCPACLVRSAIVQRANESPSVPEDEMEPREAEPTIKLTVPIEQGPGPLICRSKPLQNSLHAGFGPFYFPAHPNPFHRR